MNEKRAVVHTEQVEAGVQSRDVGLGLPEAPELSPEQEAKLWRKIDWRLMPMLSLMYLMSFLDRGTHPSTSLDRHANGDQETSVFTALRLST
jgi:hypothetical protein